MRYIIMPVIFLTLLTAAPSLLSQQSSAQPETGETKKPATDQKTATEGGAVVKYDNLWSMGIMTGTPMVGVHGEFFCIPELSVRIIGLYIFGANFVEMNKNERILSANLCLAYHIMGGKSFFDPVLMFGTVYSFHHWTTKLNLYYGADGSNHIIRQGNIQDITFGFGGGLNFICTKFFRIGLNLWLNYDYQVYISTRFRKMKGRRFILPVPLVEFTFLL